MKTVFTGLLFAFVAVTASAATPPQYVLMWGTMGSAEGQCGACYLPDVDETGDVYVPDRDNERIQRFAWDGNFVAAWGDSGSGIGEFRTPESVAVCGDTVYVADFYNDRIEMFLREGTFIGGWGGPGPGPGFFYGPRVAVDRTRSCVYVADWNNFRVQKFTLDGVFITMWGEFGQNPGEFDHPGGLAVDAVGDVYVADVTNDRIQKFSGDGTFLWVLGSEGSGPGQFSGPQDVAVDELRQLLYVADTINHRIQAFSLGGAFVMEWGSQGSGPGEFLAPLGVAVDETGNRVYVSDRGNYRIQLFAYATTGVEQTPGIDLALRVGPNPFGAHTTISYALPGDLPVSIAVFDVNGRRVRALKARRETAGEHHLSWAGTDDDGRPAASGLYFVRISTPIGSETRKVVLIR